MIMRAPNPPAEIAIGDARYTLDASLSTVKRDQRETRPVVLEANEPAIAVVRTAQLREAERAVGPVYRASPGGGVAVPTGRVFVRVAKGSRVSEQAEALRDAGYAVASVPGWSPEAAWLEANDGTVESALAGLEALARVGALEHVEPELLRPRERRSPDRRL